MEFWLFIIIAVVVATTIVSVMSAATQKAKLDYEQSLNKLKFNPANSDLRQDTLRLGRTYSNLTRDGRDITVFDEVALMNDINAACAATSVQLPIPEAKSTLSAEERLQTLSGLKEKNLITESDFERRKQQILEST